MFSDDAVVRVFDIASGDLLYENEANAGSGTDFLAGGDQVVYAGGPSDAEVSVADIESGTVLFTIDSDGTFRDLSVSPDGRLIATSGRRPRSGFGDGRTDSRTPANGWINDVAWSPPVRGSPRLEKTAMLESTTSPTRVLWRVSYSPTTTAGTGLQASPSRRMAIG